MAANLDRLPNGKWRVFRDFDSLPAATAAVGRLAEVNEAAFQPVRTVTAHVPTATQWVGGTGQTYSSRLDAVRNGEQAVSRRDDTAGNTSAPPSVAEQAAAGAREWTPGDFTGSEGTD